jgi:hypothetical protein
MQTATATEQQKDELAALLEKIRGNDGAEIGFAEALSRVIYNRSLDELDLSRARNIWFEVRAERRKRDWKSTAEDGCCMTCGKTSSLRQCMRCRDGQEDGYRPRFHSIV